MAEGNPKQASPAPVRQNAPLSVDSPYYTKDNMPEGCSPGARWLFERGCKCLGDPNWENAGWLLPGASDTETQHYEPKQAYFRRVTGREKNGDPIVEHVKDQVMEQDGSNPMNMGQPVVPVKQLVVTPPAKLVPFRQAVEMMQAREAAGRRTAAKVA